MDIATGSRSASIVSHRSAGANNQKRRSLRMLEPGGQEKSIPRRSRRRSIPLPEL